jgi:hypothetical protein
MLHDVRVLNESAQLLHEDLSTASAEWRAPQRAPSSRQRHSSCCAPLLDCHRRASLNKRMLERSNDDGIDECAILIGHTL